MGWSHPAVGSNFVKWGGGASGGPRTLHGCRETLGQQPRAESGDSAAARGQTGHLRSGGPADGRRLHSRDPAPEVAFPSNSVPASVTWGQSARCLLAPAALRRETGPGRAGRLPGPCPVGLRAAHSARRPPAREQSAHAAPGGLRPPRPAPGPAAAPLARGRRLRLPRARPSVSRGPAAPAPRAPPPPPAPRRRRRRCATCLLLGAHRAQLRPGAPGSVRGWRGRVAPPAAAQRRGPPPPSQPLGRPRTPGRVLRSRPRARASLGGRRL